MVDDAVIGRMETLVDEEHRLLKRAEQEHGLNPGEHGRLPQVGVELDRCWDLLRQLRARRSAGQDPNHAEVRDAETVEGYLG